jgi:hypothetical protein
VDAHPIQLVVEDDLRRSRLTVFFRFLLAIPHYVWLTLWTVAAVLAAVVNGLVALVLGRSARPLHRFLAAYLRYSTHVAAFLGLAANPFPGFVGSPGYPVDVEIAELRPQRRLVTLFKLVLVLPAILIGAVLGGGMALAGNAGFALSWGGVAAGAAFLAWFAALVLGRMPRGLRDVLAWCLGYGAQLGAYLFALTDRYPTTDPNEHVRTPAPPHAVQLELGDDARRSRLTVFFRLLLALPHLIWVSLWGYAVYLAVFVGWFAALVLGRLPRPLHRFIAAYLAYAAQVYAYLFLIANPFPGFTGTATYPLVIAIDPPAPQRRLVTLFRIFLVIPALLIGGALGYVLYLFAFLGWFAALVTGRMPTGLRNSGAAVIRYVAQTYAYVLLLTSQYPNSSPAVSRPAAPELAPDPEPEVAV